MNIPALYLLDEIRRALSEKDELKKAQDVADMGDTLKGSGLEISFKGGVHITGSATFKAKDVLKSFGFKFDKSSKTWSHKSMDLDFHGLYTNLTRVLK